MKKTDTATFGIYKNEAEIKIARDELVKSGFSASQISVMYPRKSGPKDFSQVQRNQFKTGAMLGAPIGAILIGIFGVTMAVGITPALGVLTYLSPGWIIFFSVIGGAIVGAVAGALIGAGTPVPAGQRYGEYMNVGGILLSVHINSDEESQRANKILQETNASDVNDVAESASWKAAIAERNWLSGKHQPSPL